MLWPVSERKVAFLFMTCNLDLPFTHSLASKGVTIKHNGVEVSVGSGFSVEERLRYGADPQLIIGKEITVQCKLIIYMSLWRCSDLIVATAF